MQGQVKPEHSTHTISGKSSDNSGEKILERFDLSLGHLRTSCIGQCIVVMQDASNRQMSVAQPTLEKRQIGVSVCQHVIAITSTLTGGGS